MRTVVIFVLVLIFVFLVLIYAIPDRSFTETVLRMEHSIGWILRAVGSAIAAVAVFALLLCGLTGLGWERQAGLVLPLLGALLLINSHWSMAAALVVVIVAFVVQQILRRSRTEV